jgi:methionyl aminopeptidase
LVLTSAEIQSLKIGGQKLVEILSVLAAAAKPGVNLLDIEHLANQETERAGAKPSFKGFEGYPAATCLCVNEQVVHCIPADYVLKEGDILMIDMGIFYQGLHTDAAITVPIGEIDSDKKRLLAGTYAALRAGVAMVGPNRPVSDISGAIEDSLNSSRLTIFKEFVGHGVGRSLHEDPYIPNYLEKGVRSPKLTANMAIAIEPITGLGGPKVEFLADGWSTRTADGKPSAVYEETVLVTDSGAEIITPIDSLVRNLKIS